MTGWSASGVCRDRPARLGHEALELQVEHFESQGQAGGLVVAVHGEVYVGEDPGDVFVCCPAGRARHKLADPLPLAWGHGLNIALGLLGSLEQRWQLCTLARYIAPCRVLPTCCDPAFMPDLVSVEAAGGLGPGVTPGPGQQGDLFGLSGRCSGRAALGCPSFE